MISSSIIFGTNAWDVFRTGLAGSVADVGWPTTHSFWSSKDGTSSFVLLVTVAFCAIVLAAIYYNRETFALGWGWIKGRSIGSPSGLPSYDGVMVIHEEVIERADEATAIPQALSDDMRAMVVGAIRETIAGIRPVEPGVLLGGDISGSINPCSEIPLEPTMGNTNPPGTRYECPGCHMVAELRIVEHGGVGYMRCDDCHARIEKAHKEQADKEVLASSLSEARAMWQAAERELEDAWEPPTDEF